jgi:hypothetical protein
MALTPRWTQLRWHEKQDRLWRTQNRFCAVAAGRGSGKTELARRRIIRFLNVRKPWPNPLYAYALPTRAQALKVAWHELLALIPPTWIHGEPNKSEMCITTKFGSKLYVVGMDKPARIEGVQWDGVVIDESSDQKPKAFDLSVLPALSHRDGWCWRIGVPKRYGVGAREFRDCFNDPDWESYSWKSSTVISEEKLAFARKTLDPLDYQEQYEADWLNAGGGVYYCFDEHENVDEHVKYYADSPIIVGCDFNINPMCWSLHQIRDVDGVRELHQFDEMAIPNCNTKRALDTLFLRYGLKHRGEWWFIPDASSQNRHTSATTSDLLQIKNDDRFPRKKVLHSSSNPLHVDRFASHNAMCLNAYGQRRYKVHPRNTVTITDHMTVAYKPGTRDVDSQGGTVGHMTDSVGYVMHKLFPIKLNSKKGTAQVIIS